jgi:hypothetical protein
MGNINTLTCFCALLCTFAFAKQHVHFVWCSSDAVACLRLGDARALGLTLGGSGLFNSYRSFCVKDPTNGIATGLLSLLLQSDHHRISVTTIFPNPPPTT